MLAEQTGHQPLGQRTLADQHEARRPDVAGNAAPVSGQSQFQPTCPARRDAGQRKRRMREFNQHLVFDVGDLVAVRQQHGAADDDQQWKHQRSSFAAESSRAYRPFERAEQDNERNEEAMLRHLHVAPRDPPALPAS